MGKIDFWMIPVLFVCLIIVASMLTYGLEIISTRYFW